MKENKADMYGMMASAFLHIVKSLASVTRESFPPTVLAAMGQPLKDEDADEMAQLPSSSQQESSPKQASTARYGKQVPTDDIEAMTELAIAASERVQKKLSPRPAQKYHPNTGKIRSPREYSDSDSGKPKFKQSIS